jgi:hypothetical protein
MAIAAMVLMAMNFWLILRGRYGLNCFYTGMGRFSIDNAIKHYG